MARKRPHTPEEIVAKHCVVAAWIGTAYAQEDAAAAHAQWRTIADQLRPKVPKFAALMTRLRTTSSPTWPLPAAHRTKLHSPNPIDRLAGDMKRRTDVIGIFLNEVAVVRMVGAMLRKQSDEWATQRARDIAVETIGARSETATLSLPGVAA